VKTANDHSGHHKGKPPINWRAVFLVAAFVIVLVSVYVFLPIAEWTRFLEGDAFRQWVRDAGYLGPFLLIVAMATAVVFSPLPSAPITIGAGALFGHLWGTVYALIGAEIGAVIAFEIARRLGRSHIEKWESAIPQLSHFSSQRRLALAVFIARLLPAISFDIISYAAGLSAMRRWPFAIATGLGMIPATFLFTHLGSGLGASQDQLLNVLLTLGVLGGFSILALLFRKSSVLPEPGGTDD